MYQAPISTKELKFKGRILNIAGRAGDPYFDHLTLGDHTNDLLLAIAEGLPEDAVVIDVGANVGLTSAIFSTCAPQGRVLSFEPSPSTFSFLETTLAINANRKLHALPTGTIGRTRRCNFLRQSPVSLCQPPFSRCEVARWGNLQRRCHDPRRFRR